MLQIKYSCTLTLRDGRMIPRRLGELAVEDHVYRNSRRRKLISRDDDTTNNTLLKTSPHVFVKLLNDVASERRYRLVVTLSDHHRISLKVSNVVFKNHAVIVSFAADAQRCITVDLECPFRGPNASLMGHVVSRMSFVTHSPRVIMKGVQWCVSHFDQKTMFVVNSVCTDDGVVVVPRLELLASRALALFATGLSSRRQAVVEDPRPERGHEACYSTARQLRRWETRSSHRTLRTRR